jgi:hypothetical protein
MAKKRRKGGRPPKTDANGHRVARYRASTRGGRASALDLCTAEIMVSPLDLEPRSARAAGGTARRTLRPLVCRRTPAVTSARS